MSGSALGAIAGNGLDMAAQFTIGLALEQLFDLLLQRVAGGLVDRGGNGGGDLLLKPASGGLRSRRPHTHNGLRRLPSSAVSASSPMSIASQGSSPRLTISILRAPRAAVASWKVWKIMVPSASASCTQKIVNRLVMFGELIDQIARSAHGEALR